MSVYGIHPQCGISTFYHQEVDICKCMMKQANKVIVAGDHSKIGRVAFAQIEKINLIDTLVTDSNANKEILNKLKKNNIKVLLSEYKGQTV